MKWKVKSKKAGNKLCLRASFSELLTPYLVNTFLIYLIPAETQVTHTISPPKTERELLHRAGRLAGRTLGQIAGEWGVAVPRDQKRAKGWIGNLMELSLGATASTQPEPDFEYIGVELKTLPVNHNGRPRESTYVCTVPLTLVNGLEWRSSTVKKKLDRVLWVPVEADPALAVASRRIGNPFIWSPDQQQQEALRTDWEEFMERIVLGDLDRIDARHGKVLQIRPKAAHAGARIRTPTASGETGQTLPRGFYLRTGFTWQLLESSKFRV